MSNELLMFLLMFWWLSMGLGAAKMGRDWLQTFIVVSYICLYATNAKMIDIFGFTTLIGIPIYAGIFLATDVLTERYGKQAGYRVIWISLAAGITFTTCAQAALLFKPEPFAQEIHNAMALLFDAALRIIAAGFVAYIIAQRFDIWFYHWIHERTGENRLWLRNNASTLTSQLLDTVIFITLAFYGTIPNDSLIQMIAVGFVGKAIVAVCDTPFMYLAKKLTPLDMK
ncbi:MAG: queuosine precursor transporter [Alphaproteobacteria bacterium]|nr:queuosine precursor transporter [Alphaproteobacteria bacterium]MDD9919984.1 queuosine precursor transporter [Alphaproteobacteria bacterium]